MWVSPVVQFCHTSWPLIFLFWQFVLHCAACSHILCICRYLKVSTTMPECFISSLPSWWVVVLFTRVTLWFVDTWFLTLAPQTNRLTLSSLLVSGLHLWCESEKWHSVWGNLQDFELTGEKPPFFPSLQHSFSQSFTFWLHTLTKVSESGCCSDCDLFMCTLLSTTSVSWLWMLFINGAMEMEEEAEVEAREEEEEASRLHPRLKISLTPWSSAPPTWWPWPAGMST